MRSVTCLFIVAAALFMVACGKPASQNTPQAASSVQPARPATASTAAAPVTTAKAGIPTGQLPHTVDPLAYTLAFTMDPTQKGFSGREQIKVRIKKPLDTIWLHGRDIQVESARLELADGKRLDIDYEQLNKAGVVKLALPRTVKAQKATLDFSFNNPYSPGLMGAYKVTADNKAYVFTQFEAIAARRAFPAFDEPRFKTPFTMSFTVPAGDKVVANTPVEKKTANDDGTVSWRFMTTKPLPTYLIAWAVGPLDIVKGPPIPPNAVRDHPVPLYGVTVAGKGDMIHYALKHAGEIVTTEEKYYGIAYPWRKLSLIAVPDFAAGAMENAGAVTFRDSLLLMDPETAPTWQKRAYWGVAAHELGHMWTGDLVTVPWWNDIWLNEAFATWMANKVIGELHPDWHARLDAVQSTQRVMHADSLVTARAIRQPIRDTGDIKTAFDGITYQKGMAVINMFEHYIGPDTFRQGMHNYLAANAYGSGTLDGLLDALSEAAGENIGPAFKTFLNQPGLPMVHVTLEKKNGTPTVHLVQSRYFPLGSGGNKNSGQWDIPVCMVYAVSGQTRKQCTMLDTHSADVALNAERMPTWLMPNEASAGYYQWTFDGKGYATLMKAFKQFSPAEQLSIAGSISAAFHDGSVDTARTMQALAPLADAGSHSVVEAPMALISLAREHLVKDKTKPAVEAYARKLYSGYDVTGDFEPGGASDSANQRQFEASMADFLAHTGQGKSVRKAAVAAADRVLGLHADDSAGKGTFDTEALAPDFIPVALRVAVREQGKPVFNALLETFKQAQSPFVRNASLEAMASATDPQLAQRVRAMTLDKKLTKRNEVATVLFGQLSQPETRDAAWRWVKTHYDELIARMPGNFGGYLPRIAGYFCNTAKANDVKQFFQGKLAAHPGSKRTLTQAMERASLCTALRKAQGPSAEKFFAPAATTATRPASQ